MQPGTSKFQIFIRVILFILLFMVSFVINPISVYTKTFDDPSHEEALLGQLSTAMVEEHEPDKHIPDQDSPHNGTPLPGEGGEPGEPLSQDTGTTGLGELTWIRTGGPLGGLGYDVRMHPLNPDILFVTDAFAGVFKSIDGGETWFPSNRGITTLGGTSGDAIPIFCLTIDPSNPDIVWAGTQNTRGIFKSMDGGETWVERVEGIVEQEGITFRGIAVDHQNSQVVYAAAEISSWAWAGREEIGREFDKTRGVVYKSMDGGRSWSPVWRGDNLARYVIIDPRDSDVIYISTGIFDREAANSNHTSNMAGGVGVLKSTDGGGTWIQANEGITNLYVGSLVMHPDDPDVLLAGSGNNAYPEGAGIFLTKDGAQTWQKVLDHGVQSVEFALSNPEIAYAGEPGWIFRSKDGGLNWQVVTGSEPGWGPPGVEAGFPIDIQVDPRDPDRVFANNYGGGNFLSEDGGRTWEVASRGYTGAQVRAIAVDPDDPARVLVSARSGIFSSLDGGSTWQGLIFPEAAGLEWNAVAIDPRETDHILAANNWTGRIVESRDGGQTWTFTEVHFREMEGWRVITFAPSDPGIVYAGSSAFFSAGGFDGNIPASGIHRSLDGGTTWQSSNDGNTMDLNISDLAIHPSDPYQVFATAPAVGLFMTRDGGDSWAKAKGLPARTRPLSVAFNPGHPERIFVGMEFGGLYVTMDGGSSWNQRSTGIPPEGTVTSILFNPTNPEILFISTIDSGVYLSQDGGTSWVAINNSLRTRAVNELAISSDGEHLYAATEGEGVFRLDLAGKAPEVLDVSATNGEAEVADVPAITNELEEPDKAEVAEVPEDQEGLEATQLPVEIPLESESDMEEKGGGAPCLGGLLPLIVVGLIGIPWCLRRIIE